MTSSRISSSPSISTETRHTVSYLGASSLRGRPRRDLLPTPLRRRCALRAQRGGLHDQQADGELVRELLLLVLPAVRHVEGHANPLLDGLRRPRLTFGGCLGADLLDAGSACCASGGTRTARPRSTRSRRWPPARSA